MATVKQAMTLFHQANLSEDKEPVSFEAGEEVTILKEWETHYFVKNAAGQVFNVPKEEIDPG